MKKVIAYGTKKSYGKVCDVLAENGRMLTLRAPDGTISCQNVCDTEPCEEVPCPNCYGGHFRPCQTCGDEGRVINIPTSVAAMPNDPDQRPGEQPKP